MRATRLSLAESLVARIHRCEAGHERLPAQNSLLRCADLRPLFPGFGITRVGDLTGLDRLGIPVWFACRPNAKSLAVSQGKGMSDEQAKISAVMEALENAIAEESGPHVTEECSIAQLEQKGLRAIALDKITRHVPESVDRHRVYSWVPGVSLLTGKTYFAPYELIGLDLRVGSRWDHANFRMSSIGLAVGTSFASATLHALLEVFENHATAALEMFGPIPGFARRVAHRNGLSSSLDEAVRCAVKADCEVVFVEVMNRIKLPTMGCFIQEKYRPEGYRSHGGFACRVNVVEAALAALLEAAQSRLTDISGARDDIVPEDYQPRQRIGISNQQNPVDISAIGLVGVASAQGRAEDELNYLLRQGRIAEDSDVYVFPLGGEEFGIHAVRVLATQADASTDNGVAKLGSDVLARFLGENGTVM